MTTETSFELHKQDLLDSGFASVLETINTKDTFDYRKKFSRKAQETENEKHREIFRIFGILMSGWLNLKTPDDPFAFIDRFNEMHLAFFSEVVGEINDDEIKSRVADLLWLRKRDYQMAEIAIDSYLVSAKFLEDFEQWVHTQSRLERAIQLAKNLGRKAKKYSTVIQAIEELLDRCNGEDPLFLSSELMRLLQESHEGDWKKYAGFAEKIAIAAEAANDFNRARRYWECQATWYFQGKDETLRRAARLRLAEAFEKESDFNLANRKPPYIMASHPIERAIVAYRRAGNADAKVEELKMKLREYQAKGVKEMPFISGGAVDISEIVMTAEKSVIGKTFKDALQSLATIRNPSNVREIRKQVEKNQEKYIFAKLFPKKLFSATGRAIAVQPSDGEESILAEMFQYVGDTYQLAGKGIIEPARQVILLEHPCRYQDLYDFISNNPFIPPDREIIVARGLLAGLNGDLLTAVHLLIPQVEESVRLILISQGVVPSSFYEPGIQDEFNLNKLLTEKKYTDPLETMFGEDLIFDFRTVLVERFGANLRNEFAHGLMNHDSFYSYAALYFWWLSLRFYLLPSLFSEIEDPDSSQSPEEVVKN